MSSVSPRKLAANQENAQRSTGPKTPEGKARVKFNALKHGLRAREVVISVGEGKEKRADFDRLVADLWQHYAPVGPVEELLVEEIAIASWRKRRARRYEVGELRANLALVDSSEVHALRDLAERVAILRDELEEDPFPGVREQVWEELECDVEQLKAKLTKIDPSARKETLVTWLQNEETELLERAHEEDTKLDMERARALVLNRENVDRAVRYETAIDRQLYRAITELEKLQRERRQVAIPASSKAQTA